MQSIYDLPTVRELERRVRTLTPEAPARWGKLNAPRMLCHIGDQMRVALGDIPSTPRSGPLRNRALRMLFVHLLPWPKGRIPTVREMLTTEPLEWGSDREEVASLLHRCHERGPQGEWAEHPAFGRLSGQEWGWLLYRHTDHHLRQFGV